MRFWDASAIVPLTVVERASEALRVLLDSDPALTVWWTTEVECASALARLERSGGHESAGKAFETLGALRQRWREIAPARGVRREAIRFLRRYPLRAADALQLAAAFEASERDPPSLAFVTLDERLREAAESEGFACLPTF